MPFIVDIISNVRRNNIRLLNDYKLANIVLLASTTILFLAFTCHRFQTVTLYFRNAAFKNVLTEIRKQSTYTFAYSEGDFQFAKPVTIDIQNRPLSEALRLVFLDQPFNYNIIDRVVVIKLKEKSVLSQPSSSQALKQQIDVKGRVINFNGEPINGVSIYVKGSKYGTFTNDEGEFSLVKIESSSTLLLSGTNIESTEYPINGKSDLLITVRGKASKLDQVQVIAYGTTSKRLSTGNTYTVKSDDIERQPINNPLLALQGRVPGLEVVQGSGIPGSGLAIRVQGRNNLNPNLVGSDPFIVIDGVPFSSQNLSTFLGGADPGNPILGRSGDNSLTGNFGNPLSSINPNDIESIDVLKDADATAIYGSRAANGAILITTKRGKSGPMKITFNFQDGVGTVGKKLKMLDSRQYMEMRREAKRNDNAGILVSDFDLRGVWDTTRYTNWQKELLGGNARNTNINTGVSGGSQTIQYLVSGTWARETTVFPGDFSNTRASVHFHLSASDVDKRLKVQFGGSYMFNNNRLPGIDYTEVALNLPPVAPPLFAQDGSLNWAPDLTTGNSSWFNPLARQYNLFDTKTGNLIANSSIEYRIIPGLAVKVNLGYTNTSTDQFSGEYNESFKPESRANRVRTAFFSANNIRSWIMEPQLNYIRSFSNTQFNIMIGSTLQEQRSEGRSFMISGQPSDQLLRNLEAGGTFRPTGSDLSLYRYSALFARVGINLKRRYLVNLTGRRDGSSRFGENNQLNNFGAAGIGWIFSDEPFLKSMLPFINFGKIRGSYGITGNDQLGNYRFMSLYRTSTVGIPYQGLQGLRPEGLPNPNLEWETTRKLQAGIDLGIFSERLLLTVNYVRNRSSNNLTEVFLPMITGYPNINDNLNAEVQNTGWEISLNTENIQTSNFKWSTAVNVTFPQNKLISFPDLEQSSLGYILKVGYPLNIARYYSYWGVDPETGTYRISDVSGHPTDSPSPEDLNKYYQTGARWYGGLQNSLSYNGFELDVLAQFTKQKAEHILELGIPGRIVTSFSTSGNQPVDVMNRWQKPGDITNYQRFGTRSSLGAFEKGDRGFRDASFLRLKNVSLSYRFPTRLIKPLYINQLRLYVNAQNLITITKYKGLDPETLGTTSLPPLKMIVVGVHVSF